MPSSLQNNIPIVIEILGMYNPKSILECGCGFGKYGHLIREYFDVNKYKQIKKDNWVLTLDTIEVFEDYISPAHRYYYDNIIIGDFTQKIDVVGQYDVCLMVDVIEHLEKTEAYKFIDKALEHCKQIIMVMPDHDYKQGPEFGNDYETHRSVWSLNDFKDYYPLLRHNKNNSLFVVITKKRGVNK